MYNLERLSPFVAQIEKWKGFTQSMGKKHKEKEKLTGGWESIHAVIWMLGLALIAWQGWWWPGILVLVAISILYEAIIKQIAPDAFVKVVKDDDGNEVVKAARPFEQPAPAAPAAPIHRADLLPTNCPRCGAPTRGHEVRWTGEQSADCPFCGSNLPMKRN